jgi:hypothetical protein
MGPGICGPGLGREKTLRDSGGPDPAPAPAVLTLQGMTFQPEPLMGSARLPVAWPSARKLRRIWPRQVTRRPAERPLRLAPPSKRPKRPPPHVVSRLASHASVSGLASVLRLRSARRLGRW